MTTAVTGGQGIGHRPPSASPAAAPPVARRALRPSSPAPERTVVWRVLQTLVVFLVFGQRIAIPVGSSYISPTLLAVMVATLVLYRRREVTEDRTRTLAYVTVASACLAAGLVTLLLGLPDTSMQSLLLLVVLYAPFCFVLRADLRRLYLPLLRFLSGCLVVIGVIAVVQFAAQAAHLWSYQDLLASVLPKHFIVQGYNTAYPIQYGSPIYKSNGVFLLEPSFCSQFMALGIIIQLLLREKLWRVALFGAALVATVSGTGVLLLGSGLLVQMIRRGPRWSMRVVLAIAVSAGLAALTPAGRVTLQRATETSNPGSSGHQRFISPYARMWNDLATPRAILVGTGPGSSDREATRIAQLTGLSTVSPTIPKALTEYGLVAGTGLLAVIGGLILWGAPSSTLAVALFVFFFALSGDLLQAQTVYVCWLLTSLFGRPRARVAAATRRPVRTTSGSAPPIWPRPSTRTPAR